MSSFDFPDIPQPRANPAMMLGAASPLWAYFGAAAAGGVAYWLMTHWARPVSLEAWLATARDLPASGPVVEAAETVAETPGSTVASSPAGSEPRAVGGEATPVTPTLAEAPVAAPVEPPAEPDPIADATPALATDVEAVPKARLKKSAPSVQEGES